MSAVFGLELELDQRQKQLFDDFDFFLQLEKDIKEFEQKKEQKQKIGLDQTTTVPVSSHSAIGTSASFFSSTEPQPSLTQKIESPRKRN